MSAQDAFGSANATDSVRAINGSRTRGAGARHSIRFDVVGSVVVGDLYLPADYQPEVRRPGVVVAGSLTSVKEQMSGRYAAELAARGFLALAIDYRRFGESGGEPRQYDNADDKAIDLSAAAAYLAARPDVAPGVGLLGICTSGGCVLYAAARDGRIAAVATVAAHLAEPSVIASVPIYGGPDGIERHRAEGRAARARYLETGENRMIVCYHDSDPGAGFVGPLSYYWDPARGAVPAWKNALSVMSWQPWLDFDPVREARRVTAPALLVHSDGCVMPEQARKVYGVLQGPKELCWLTGNHLDFYDDPAKVGEAADAISAHFRKHLG